MVRFENTKTAYKLKTDQELRKAYLLFRLFSKQLLVRFGGKLVLFLLRLRIPIKGILKNTVYQQFCAGVTENDSMELVNLLADLNVKSYMHYAAEGQLTEKGMDASLNHVLKTLTYSSANSALPFAVFKATAFGSTHLFKKKSAEIQLDKEESVAWARVLDRIRSCCEYAKSKGIRLLIDAEESWLQKTIDEIAFDIMLQYNRGEQVFIFNTVQMYRKDRLSYLDNLLEIAKKEKFKLGIKLVRGAYMEKENLRAIEKGYPSPICVSKQATDANFNAALKLILENLNHCELFLGSHSEESASKLVKWMEDQKMPPNHPKIWFSQLYGMADHISFNWQLKDTKSLNTFHTVL